MRPRVFAVWRTRERRRGYKKGLIPVEAAPDKVVLGAGIDAYDHVVALRNEIDDPVLREDLKLNVRIPSRELGRDPTHDHLA